MYLVQFEGFVGIFLWFVTFQFDLMLNKMRACLNFLLEDTVQSCLSWRTVNTLSGWLFHHASTSSGALCWISDHATEWCAVGFWDITASRSRERPVSWYFLSITLRRRINEPNPKVHFVIIGCTLCRLCVDCTSNMLWLHRLQGLYTITSYRVLSAHVQNTFSKQTAESCINRTTAPLWCPQLSM